MFENFKDDWEFIYSIWAHKKLSFNMKTTFIKELIQRKIENIRIVLKTEKREIKKELKNIFGELKLKKMNLDLRKNIKNLLNELEEIQNSLNKANKEIDDLKNELKEKKKCSHLEAENEKIKENCEEDKKQMLDNANKEINDLKSEIKDHEEDKQLLQNQLNEKNTIVNGLLKENEKIKENCEKDKKMLDNFFK